MRSRFACESLQRTEGRTMKTRREVLRLIPPVMLAGAATATATADFTRIDTHVHIHRDAPALLSAIKTANWRGLDIVVCPASGDEKFDLDESLAPRRRSLATAAEHSPGRPPSTPAASKTQTSPSARSPAFANRSRTARSRVKIWKNIGMSIKGKSGAYLLPDDRALLPIYEAIRKAGKTLVAHLAEPDGAWLPLDAKNPELRYYSANPQWHMYGKAGAPVKEDILKARDRVLAAMPKLRVVGCHLGSDEDDLDRLAKRLDAYPNFAVDTAARIRYFARGDREQVRQFLTRYQDRILYATDFSLREGEPAAAARSLQNVHDRDWAFFSGADAMEYDGKPTRGLELPERVLRKLFRENALRWLPGIEA